MSRCLACGRRAAEWTCILSPDSNPVYSPQQVFGQTTVSHHLFPTHRPMANRQLRESLQIYTGLPRSEDTSHHVCTLRLRLSEAADLDFPSLSASRPSSHCHSCQPMVLSSGSCDRFRFLCQMAMIFSTYKVLGQVAQGKHFHGVGV